MSAAEPSDEEVIARVQHGDHEAFAILVTRHQDHFARYAAGMLGSDDEAADVIQESFIRAFRAIRDCHDPSNFRNWFFRIVSNRCRTHLRRRRGEPLSAAAGVHASGNPGLTAEAADLSRRVREAIQTLPAEQREALLLKYLEEMELPEMSSLLGVSVPALKMRLLRARSALRTRLEGVFHDRP